jgi:hypothetical protein
MKPKTIQPNCAICRWKRTKFEEPDNCGAQGGQWLSLVYNSAACRKLYEPTEMKNRDGSISTRGKWKTKK